jgi:hypothetical protein
MKTKKMSLANIKGKLSRAEMKQIMAGSTNCGCTGDADCVTNHCGSKCLRYNGNYVCVSWPF